MSKIMRNFINVCKEVYEKFGTKIKISIVKLLFLKGSKHFLHFSLALNNQYRFKFSVTPVLFCFSKNWKMWKEYFQKCRIFEKTEMKRKYNAIF